MLESNWIVDAMCLNPTGSSMPCSGFLKLCEPRYDDGVVFSSFLNCVGLQNDCGCAVDAAFLIVLDNLATPLC